LQRDELFAALEMAFYTPFFPHCHFNPFIFLHLIQLGVIEI